jgi:isocitrate lyase
MGGKVLVSTQEHIDRLVAARLACDILGCNLILVARTDAEAQNAPAGRNSIDVQNEWTQAACLMTFSEAVVATIEKIATVQPYRKRQMRDQWLAADPARRISDQILGTTNAVSRPESRFYQLCFTRWGCCSYKSHLLPTTKMTFSVDM